MSNEMISRRAVLAGTAAASAASLFPAAASMAQSAAATAAPNQIRPFRVAVPQEVLTDLRRRILATRWADRETVPDQTQGTQLSTIQSLARYWATDYDWRRCETKLNALPQFMTAIDGVDKIHSNSFDNYGVIVIEFLFSKDLQQATQDVRDKISGARQDLPPEMEEPVVARFDFSDWPIISLTLSSDKYSPAELTKIADPGIKGDLQGVYGVAQYNHALLMGLHAAGFDVACAHAKSENALVNERQAAGIRQLWLSSGEFGPSLTDPSDAVRILGEVRPDVVFTHSPADYLLDHEMTSVIARAAAFGAPTPNLFRDRGHKPPRDFAVDCFQTRPASLRGIKRLRQPRPVAVESMDFGLTILGHAAGVAPAVESLIEKGQRLRQSLQSRIGRRQPGHPDTSPRANLVKCQPPTAPARGAKPHCRKGLMARD